MLNFQLKGPVLIGSLHKAIYKRKEIALYVKKVLVSCHVCLVCLLCSYICVKCALRMWFKCVTQGLFSVLKPSQNWPCGLLTNTRFTLWLLLERYDWSHPGVWSARSMKVSIHFIDHLTAYVIISYLSRERKRRRIQFAYLCFTLSCIFNCASAIQELN